MEYVKPRILLFHQRNVKICHPVCELNLEGIKITKKTVSKYCKRSRGEMTLCELPRSGGPSMFQRQHYEFIDAKTLKTSYSAGKTININVIDSNSESSYRLRTKDNVIYTKAVKCR